MNRDMTGLVLAGGASRRMGTDKARLAVDGRPLVVLVASRLATVCPAVLVAPGGRRLAGVPWPQVDDRVAGHGPLAGVLGGLAAATTPLVAVVAVDMPDCDPALLLRLAGAWTGQPAVVPVQDGTAQPLHAVYATAALPRLAAAFDAGERSLTRALRRVGALHLPVVAAAGWARDLDTPADLARFRRRARGGRPAASRGYPASDMSLPSLGPVVDATDVVFRLLLPADVVRRVRLCQQLSRPRTALTLQARRTAGGQRLWQGRLRRPDVDRLEYQYELEFVDGTRELRLDPHNPLRAPGPFGDKSVVEFPGYQPPKWLDATRVRGRFLTLGLASDLLGATLNVGLWTSPRLDVEHPAPLLVVHDGPEFERYSALLQFVDAMIDQGRLPPMRVVLLPPADRNEHYAASPLYARALARELMPVIDWLAPQPAARPDGRSWRIGMGASLGALAVLHVHRRYPALFGGMFLQSGSFFQRRTDRHESAFFRFDRIVAFVDDVCGATRATRPVPIGMTCGTVEENLANNRRVRDALALQGYDVAFAEHRDGHNWVGWRDAFDPHLADLIDRTLQ